MARLGKATLTAAVLAATVASAPEANATSTRIYTLGAMNRFVVDDANKWLYPQMITKFGSLFYIELFGSGPSRAFTAPTSARGAAQPDGPGGLAGVDLAIFDAAEAVPVMQTAGGGMILKLTDDLFLGAHLSDYENPIVPSFLALISASSQGSASAFPWLPVAPDAPANSNRKWDLFFAYNLQDVARFGLNFSFGSANYFRDPNDNDPMVPADAQGNTETRKVDEIATSEMGFLLGAGFDLGDSASVDAGLGIRFYSLTYFPNDRDLIDGGGGLDLSADVRAMIGLTEWWELVPALSFRYVSLSGADLANYTTGLSYNDADDTVRARYFITDVAANRLLFDLGVAGHFKPTDAVDFWAGTGFTIARWAASFDNTIPDAPDSGLVRDQNLEFSRDSISTTAIPYLRVAMEARIFSWLDFRAGVVKYLRGDSVKEDKLDNNDADQNRLNTVSRDFPFFDYFLGAAVHYEGLFLDFQVDPAFFQRGPNFLSGASGNMFVNASLGYKF